MWKTYFWFLKWVTVIANYSSTPLTMNLIEVTNKFFSSTKLMLQNKYSNTSNGFAHATNCETVISAISYSYNYQQNELRHFALKELFDVFLTSRGEKNSSPPSIPSIQCCATVWATFRKQQILQLWMEGTGVGCRFFCSLKLPYLNTMSQQFSQQL